MVIISERPAEIETAPCPGTGRAISSSARTAVSDRHPRRTPDPFMLLMPCPMVRPPRPSASAAAKIQTLPPSSAGPSPGTVAEMAEHVRFTIETGLPIYSATPTVPGSGATTRTPTACSASTSPKAPTCRSTARPPRPRRPRAQRTASTDPRLDETIRSARHALRSPLRPPAYWWHTHRRWPAHGGTSRRRRLGRRMPPIGINDGRPSARADFKHQGARGSRATRAGRVPRAPAARHGAPTAPATPQPARSTSSPSWTIAVAAAMSGPGSRSPSR